MTELEVAGRVKCQKDIVLSGITFNDSETVQPIISKLSLAEMVVIPIMLGCPHRRAACAVLIKNAICNHRGHRRPFKAVWPPQGLGRALRTTPQCTCR